MHTVAYNLREAVLVIKLLVQKQTRGYDKRNSLRWRKIPTITLVVSTLQCPYCVSIDVLSPTWSRRQCCLGAINTGDLYRCYTRRHRLSDRLHKILLYTVSQKNRTRVLCLITLIKIEHYE